LREPRTPSVLSKRSKTGRPTIKKKRMSAGVPSSGRRGGYKQKQGVTVPAAKKPTGVPSQARWERRELQHDGENKRSKGGKLGWLCSLKTHKELKKRGRPRPKDINCERTGTQGKKGAQNVQKKKKNKNTPNPPMPSDTRSKRRFRVEYRPGRNQKTLERGKKKGGWGGPPG